MKPSHVDAQVSYGLPRKGLPSAAAFTRWVEAAVARRRKPTEVSIHVVDANEGRELNLRYRHKDYATNVLSFCADLPAEIEHPLLGDVILCAPVIELEAQAQGKPIMDHWAHLTIHGVLHLLGHDHETIAEAREMEALERQILDSIGIPDPYAER